MTPKSGINVCPNPKCHKNIEEPILLNDFSKTPTEHYYACPHCLIKLIMNTENEEGLVEGPEPEVSSPLHPSLEKVLNAISAKPRKEGEGREGGEDEEDREGKEEPPVKPPKEEEKGPEGCHHHFGYLAQRPKDAPIPQECLTCPKIVECMLNFSRP